MQDRAVSVGADFHRARGLPLVAERVHVTNNRVADLALRLGEDVHWTDVGHLVDGRHERDGGAGHVGNTVRPDATGDNDVLGFNPALVSHHGGDLLEPGAGLILGLDVEHFSVGEHLEAGLFDRLVAEKCAGVEGVDDADAGATEATENHIFIDERHELFDLRRGQQFGLNAPRLRRRHPALELVHPLGCAGHFDATGVNAAFDVAVLVGALHTEQCHLLVVIDREDEVRCMTSRTTGVRERALVDEHHVSPAKSGEMAHQAVADDSGANDDDLGGSGEFLVTHGGARFGKAKSCERGLTPYVTI